MMRPARPAPGGPAVSGQTSVEFLAEYQATVCRGGLEMPEPLAVMSARYDPESGRLTFDLANEMSVSLPSRSIAAFADLSPQQLATVAVTADGSGLCFQASDRELFLPSLIRGLLRYPHMSHTGRGASV